MTACAHLCMAVQVLELLNEQLAKHVLSAGRAVQATR